MLSLDQLTRIKMAVDARLIERDVSALLRGVRKAISEELRIEESEVQSRDSLIERLGCDSVDFVRVIASIESRYGCTIRYEWALQNMRADSADDASNLDGDTLERMRLIMPDIDETEAAANDISSSQILSLVTPVTLVRWIVMDSVIQEEVSEFCNR